MGMQGKRARWDSGVVADCAALSGAAPASAFCSAERLRKDFPPLMCKAGSGIPKVMNFHMSNGMRFHELIHNWKEFSNGDLYIRFHNDGTTFWYYEVNPSRPMEGQELERLVNVGQHVSPNLFGYSNAGAGVKTLLLHYPLQFYATNKVPHNGLSGIITFLARDGREKQPTPGDKDEDGSSTGGFYRVQYTYTDLDNPRYVRHLDGMTKEEFITSERGMCALLRNEMKCIDTDRHPIEDVGSNQEVRLHLLHEIQFLALQPPSTPQFAESNSFVSLYRSVTERPEIRIQENGEVMLVQKIGNKTDDDVVLSADSKFDETALSDEFARQFFDPVNVDGKPLVAFLQGKPIKWVAGTTAPTQFGLPFATLENSFRLNADQQQQYRDASDIEGTFDVCLKVDATTTVTETVAYHARGFIPSQLYREKFNILPNAFGFQYYANGVLSPAPLELPSVHKGNNVHGKSTFQNLVFQVNLKTRYIGTVIQPSKENLKPAILERVTKDIEKHLYVDTPKNKEKEKTAGILLKCLLCIVKPKNDTGLLAPGWQHFHAIVDKTLGYSTLSPPVPAEGLFDLLNTVVHTETAQHASKRLADATKKQTKAAKEHAKEHTKALLPPMPPLLLDDPFVADDTAGKDEVHINPFDPSEIGPVELSDSLSERVFSGSRQVKPRALFNIEPEPVKRRGASTTTKRSASKKKAGKPNELLPLAGDLTAQLGIKQNEVDGLRIELNNEKAKVAELVMERTVNLARVHAASSIKTRLTLSKKSTGEKPNDLLPLTENLAAQLDAKQSELDDLHIELNNERTKVAKLTMDCKANLARAHAAEHQLQVLMEERYALPREVHIAETVLQPNDTEHNNTQHHNVHDSTQQSNVHSSTQQPNAHDSTQHHNAHDSIQHNITPGEDVEDEELILMSVTERCLCEED